MHRFRSLCVAGLTLLIASTAQAQTLSTTTANNGTGGVFMTFTPLLASLRITSFESYFGGEVGSSVQVEMWVRSGSYSGFTGSSAGWTLAETMTATRNGSTVLSPITLSTALDLLMGTSTSVYLHALGQQAGTYMRYHGDETGIEGTTWSNAELEMFSDIARTGGVPFSGPEISARTFAGNVNYERLVSSVPEPGAILLLLSGAVGLVATGVRRKRAI